MSFSEKCRRFESCSFYKKKIKMEQDWKKMGFNSKEEYEKFLDTKMRDLLDKIKKHPKLLDVFKRLKDK